MPTIPPGIDSIPSNQIPNTFSSAWFINFIRTWLRAADVRNATAGPGITITGQGIIPATISVTGGLTGTIIITTAKLTPGGTEGSLTYIDGILTAQTPAT